MKLNHPFEVMCVCVCVVTTCLYGAELCVFSLFFFVQTPKWSMTSYHLCAYYVMVCVTQSNFNICLSLTLSDCRRVSLSKLIQKGFHPTTAVEYQQSALKCRCDSCELQNKKLNNIINWQTHIFHIHMRVKIQTTRSFHLRSQRQQCTLQTAFATNTGVFIHWL